MLNSHKAPIRSLLVGLFAVAGCSHGGTEMHAPPGPDMTVAAPDAAAPGDDLSTTTPPVNADLGPLDLDVEPATLQTIMITTGQPTPTVAYTATLGGAAVSVGWSVDRGDIGSVVVGPAQGTTFSPTGNVAGLVNVTATLNGVTIQRQVMVQIVATQNGGDPTNPIEGTQFPTSPGTINSGGGVGGVGGEGLGGAVSDPGTSTALGAPVDNGSNLGLAFLYPYANTVFPRGLLAPLVMWTWTTGDADAIQMTLKDTSGNFSWTGQFGRPAVLASTGGKFIRMPIPQDVWEQATNTAGGADKLTLTLTVASGGVAHGPIAQTWTIAPGRVSGIIYYNSYGTNLVQNSGSDKSVGNGLEFGGAVLSIHVGDTAPKLVAGTTSTNNTGCRVCHSVSADGSRLIVQHGDSYGTSSAYDLSATMAPVEHNPLPISTTFPGMYPDGSQALSSTTQLLPLPNDSPALTATGLTVYGGNLGAPAFSPDKTMIAFNPMGGTGVSDPTQKLVVMNFSATTNAFTNPITIVDDSATNNASIRPGWPAFLPDSKSVVFHHQSAYDSGDGNGSGQLYTRKGCKAQIAWTNLTDSSHVTALNQLNGMDSTGTSYLPKLTTASTVTCTGDGTTVSTINPLHDDDVDLNYEPTVAPVASGGYAWVVFTSRRMYGNEATIPPFCSDPRGVDLINNVTPKKLWVAAVDLNAAPGTDASHPAFYLPAQELLAGNSRGFWVLDPCRADGSSCASGDQCCNGYCEPNGTGGALVCSDTPPNSQCSQLSDKCTTAADCCDKTNLCINGFCSESPIS
ncbi:MAG TPA: hypothetical protein VIA18_30690 [Polyangia bacterium]|nr:hypothetical protein [Polyangia bacterium]